MSWGTRFFLVCRRYWNAKQLHRVTFQDAAGNLSGYGYYVVRAVDGRGRHIGKLVATISSEPSVGAQAHGFSSESSQYVTIADLCLDNPWRGLGIGSKLFLHALNHFRSILNEDAMIDGWVQPQEQRRFWQRFGFRFAEKDGKLYMAACIKDLLVPAQN